MQQAAQVRDDVYFLPSQAPPPVAVVEETPAEEPAKPADDYYDAGSAAQANGTGNYYDMAYNDPYYYNYGRFGFGSGMGWQTGWNGPGWGMGMGWGSGMGWSTSLSFGWGSPYYGGYGGWGSPYGGYGYGGWGNPYYGGYSPWGWNDPWNSYGYGNYYGPCGNCYGCYSPIIVGGSSSGVVVGHRPSVNGSGMATAGTVGQARASFRDPVGLNPTLESGYSSGRSGRSITNTPSRQIGRPDQSFGRPAERPSGNRPAIGTDRPARQRTTPQERNGGSDRSISSPSRSGGGGNSGGGNSGGGSRSGGGGRPR